MKILSTIGSIVMLLSPLAALAASDNSFRVTTPEGRNVVVTLVTDDIVRVDNYAKGEKLILSPASVLTESTASAPSVSYTDGVARVISTPTGVVISIDPATGGVTISAGADRAVSDNGLRTVSGDKQQLSLSTMGGGSFYGAGERGYSFNLAGDTLVMYNKQNYGYTAGESRIKQMNITMPLFLSSNGYAVVFDDFAAAEMVMSNPIVYTTESRRPVSYYFINGAGSLADVTSRLSSLTGRQDLPPFWAMGYITSKYGYHTEAETRGVVDTLRRAGYPLDGIVLDLYWYGKEQDMGRLAWDKDQWPNHSKMLADLKKQGVNLVAISQPYVLRNGRAIDNYNELAPKGMFVKDSLGNPQEVKIWVGEGGMFDVSNPDTRAWLRNRYKELTVDGITGWWGDLGEPEVHPETGRHANGLTAREYHNLYGNDWSSIIYDLFREEFPDTRLMTLMRGGTTGLQRYSVYPWSTDVSRSWGGLQPQVIIMLNSGLSGLGYMSHDVGGFAIDPEHPYDPELYVRWLQLGTFSPILRTHAQATAEPFKYPDHQNIILPLIQARYRWLPYNYTLAYENSALGLPLVRPLNFYSPGSSRYDDITDEYLWGRDVLVAPVLTPGTTERRVIFPEGTWVDYTNPSRVYNGGDTIMYPAPLDVLPMFVRAGSFIPQADYAMKNTGDYRPDRLTVEYFPVKGTGKTSYTLFEDDRKSTTSLRDNAYTLVTFTGDESADGTIDITVTADGTYPEAPLSRRLTFAIHNVPAPVPPADITVNGNYVNRRAIRYNPDTATLTVMTGWEPASGPLELKIKTTR